MRAFPVPPKPPKVPPVLVTPLAVADTEVATTPAALAERTDTAERYVREWLNAHAAAGYVEYHPENGTYSLSPEQSMLFAEEGGPAFIVGAFQVATGAAAIRPALEQAFRTGEGLPWHQHDSAYRL